MEDGHGLVIERNTPPMGGDSGRMGEEQRNGLGVQAGHRFESAAG